jgi:hypothetical protein
VIASYLILRFLIGVHFGLTAGDHWALFVCESGGVLQYRKTFLSRLPKGLQDTQVGMKVCKGLP